MSFSSAISAEAEKEGITGRSHRAVCVVAVASLSRAVPMAQMRNLPKPGAKWICHESPVAVSSH